MVDDPDGAAALSARCLYRAKITFPFRPFHSSFPVLHSIGRFSLEAKQCRVARTDNRTIAPQPPYEQTAFRRMCECRLDPRYLSYRVGRCCFSASSSLADSVAASIILNPGFAELMTRVIKSVASCHETQCSFIQLSGDSFQGLS